MKPRGIPENSETSDLLALRQGDWRWFGDMYERLFPQLFNYANGITHDAAMAEDAVGDVFCRLWENRETVEISVSIKAYLFKSVYNACVNMLKHRNIHNAYCEFFLQNYTDEADASDYPLSQLMARDISGIVERTLAQLPEQCRRIFTMSRIDGLSHEDIAKKLKISVNTIKTQINRALKKMSVALRDYIAD